jgi:hypothetical protein
MRGELDYAQHEASPFRAARLLISNPAEGRGFAAEIVSNSPQRLCAGPYRANPIEGQP